MRMTPIAQRTSAIQPVRNDVFGQLTSDLGPLYAQMVLGLLRAVALALIDRKPNTDTTTIEGVKVLSSAAFALSRLRV
jgi:hypothetical protein